MEKNLSVEIDNLFDPSKEAKVSEPTNAGVIDSDDWYMLVGIDFPYEGCWKVTSRYLGQELSFVVRTVDADGSSQDAT